MPPHRCGRHVRNHHDRRQDLMARARSLSRASDRETRKPPRVGTWKRPEKAMVRRSQRMIWPQSGTGAAQPEGNSMTSGYRCIPTGGTAVSKGGTALPHLNANVPRTFGPQTTLSVPHSGYQGTPARDTAVPLPPVPRYPSQRSRSSRNSGPSSGIPGSSTCTYLISSFSPRSAAPLPNISSTRLGLCSASRIPRSERSVRGIRTPPRASGASPPASSSEPGPAGVR